MNQLAKESSPYLLQHAHNPVNWYTWNDEAIAKAREENKPILLSIGYAACHWCHRMAHESFDDIETANLMNELFINIKVDREERPDLDKIYQTAHYLLTNQSGGWPLTVFISPTDFAAFFSGTYFPLKPMQQLPSFKDVLQRVSDAYHNQSADILAQNEHLIKVLNNTQKPQENINLDLTPINAALDALHHSFDKIHGGFGTAPKFPHPTSLEFLFDHDSPMATTSLIHMAQGGIYDQLGGGFFRYTVDEKWHIPHFEKMLYDNAQLLYLYSLAAKQNDLFANTAKATADFIIEKMQSADGGYYSSIDADSEGHEGQYYVWDKTEIQKLLTTNEYQLTESFFGLMHPSNFEGKYHFYIANPSDEDEVISSIKKKLLLARNARVEPHCDTKILTSWNSLMIKAMAIASTELNEPRYLASAQKALDFIKNHYWRNQKLFTTHNIPAYVDDYAYLIDALLTMHKLSNDNTQLEWAIELTETMLLHFSDTLSGGFFFTSDEQETILYRPKNMLDEATPSGNGIAAQALLNLGYLLSEPRYIEAAEKTIKAAWPILPQYPAEHCSLLKAVQMLLDAG